MRILADLCAKFVSNCQQLPKCLPGALPVSTPGFFPGSNESSMLSDMINTLKVDCTPEQLEAWETGVNIPDTMPNVPPCAEGFREKRNHAGEIGPNLRPAAVFG